MVSLLNPKYHFLAFRELTTLLTRHRQLTIEMAKREIADRYMGQIFGLFWAVGHPLILMVVYVFVFGYIFKMRIGGTRELPLDYTTYLLAGLIPWFSFQEAMGKSSTVIINNANLVKQVIFPIEILPVKGVIASLITQLIFLVLLIVYVLITHHALPWTYTLLPGLLLLQTLGMIGVAYTLAAIGTYFRDVKDFVQVFTVVNFYLLPILYLPESVPTLFRPILYLNPFSYLVWCYQDALYFGRFEHWWAWPVFIVMSLGIFIMGYRLFRKLKVMFGNVL
ncbi:MAG: ABC transporter permease [Anaerolineales bacterium]|nr:ABC transporter permease [Anaerolineales bacterium]